MTIQPAKYFLALAAIAIMPTLVLAIAQMVGHFKIPEDVIVTATFFTFFSVFLSLNAFSYRRQVTSERKPGRSGILWHFWLSLFALTLIPFAAHIVAPAVKARGFKITLSILSIGFLLFIVGQVVFLVNWWKCKYRQV